MSKRGDSIQIGKKSKAIEAYAGKKVNEVFNLTEQEFEILSDEDKIKRLNDFMNSNGVKLSRKSTEQKEQDKLLSDLDLKLETLRSILLNGTEEQKSIINNIINERNNLIEIEELERRKKEIEDKIKELKGE